MSKAAKEAPKPGPVLERLTRPGPRRVLAIDAGGGRVLLALGQLAEIERRLALRSGSDQFRLCDYYDLICGVSVGAVAAAALAQGATAAEAAELMLSACAALAAEDEAARGQARTSHDPNAFAAVLASKWGDMRLGDPTIRTGLAMVLRRFDRGLWVVSNDPRAPGWAARMKPRILAVTEEGEAPAPAEEGEKPEPGLADARLAALGVGACAGASMFDGRMLEIWPGEAPVALVDAQSMGVFNPSLLALRLATNPVDGFGWDTGGDRLLVTSVGAGLWRSSSTEADVAALGFARAAPGAALGYLATRQGLRESGRTVVDLMRSLGGDPPIVPAGANVAAPTPLSASPLSPVPLFLFARFDIDLDLVTLTGLNVAAAADDLAALRRDAITPATRLSLLYTIGQRGAAALLAPSDPNDPRNVERAYFPRGFEPAGFGKRIRVGPELRLEALGRVFGRLEESDGD